jgi:HEAT repeat protein
MKILLLTTVVACGVLTHPGAAQTPLALAFQDLRSSDPVKVEKTKETIALTFEQEFPTIEKDTATICGTLSDPDPYLRLQAAAILETIVRIAPEHNQVVQACTPGLLVAGRDTSTEVRNNALFALAMNPTGTPPQAESVFQDALKSDNLRTAEVGAAGLLRVGGVNAAADEKLVADALSNAPDAKHKVNLLYAITGSGTHSDVVFQSTKQALNDPDANVQQAALHALVKTGPDKSSVTVALQNVQSSTSANAATKQRAQSLLNSMAK